MERKGMGLDKVGSVVRLAVGILAIGMGALAVYTELAGTRYGRVSTGRIAQIYGIAIILLGAYMAAAGIYGLVRIRKKPKDEAS